MSHSRRILHLPTVDGLIHTVDGLMDSSTSVTSFLPDKVPRLESADDKLQLLEDHGFLFQENADIGRLVDGLFAESRIRSSDVKLDYFRPTLERDPVSKK